LRRRDAIQVLRDIIKVCADNSVVISSVALIAPTQTNALSGYQLRIGTTLDYACRNMLMPLLKEKALEMEKKDGAVFIFQRQRS
jgi:hypothetical protein